MIILLKQIYLPPYRTFFVCVFLSLNIYLVQGQDAAVYRDNRGRKITFSVQPILDGYKRILVNTKRSLKDYGIKSDSLINFDYDLFGRKVFDDYSVVLGLTSANLRLKGVTSGSTKQIVYEQVYGSIPIYNTEIVIFTTRKAWAHSIHATILNDFHCDTVPRITREEAIKIASDSSTSGQVEFSAPNLMIISMRDDINHAGLVWMIPTNSHFEPVYLVDAKTGKVDRIVVLESIPR